MNKNNYISQNILKKLYSTMFLIRRTEERIADILSKQDPENKEIKTPCHLYIGQEAVAVGVCANLKKTDYVFGTHRSHGYYLAKGGDLNLMMAEIYGRLSGCSQGRGGSMHLVAPEVGLMGISAIVGGSMPLGVGAALASKIKKNKRIAVSFFGDGAVNEGSFHESLNLASLYKLPVIFVCENNSYSTHVPIDEHLANTAIYEKAMAYNMQGIRTNGNDVLKVFQTIKDLIIDVRNCKGPVLVECMTYRWRGHVGPNYDVDKGLRSQKELDSWIRKCPIKKLEHYMMRENFENLLDAKIKKQIIKRIDTKIDKAFEFAKKSQQPDKKELLKNVFKE